MMPTELASSNLNLKINMAIIDYKNIVFIGLGPLEFLTVKNFICKNNVLQVKAYNRSIKKPERWMEKLDDILY